MRKLLAAFLFAFVGTFVFVSTDISCAPLRSTKLLVMSYNIHTGVGMDQRLDLQRIADVITKEHPDLVGLQEVDRGVKRTQGIDEITELALLTNMDFAFAHNLDYHGGQYGVAILSRFPILKTDHRMYKNKREAERRGMIRIEVNVDGHKLSFATTHLDYQYEDGRIFEAGQLLNFLHEPKGPLILVGDFNVEPGADSYKLMVSVFRDAWLDATKDILGLSYPADKPRKRIDYIMFRPNEGLKAKRAWTVDSLASDHLAVMAVLEMRPQ